MSNPYLARNLVDDGDPVLDAVDPGLAGVTDDYIEARLRETLTNNGYASAPEADGPRPETGGPVDAELATSWWGMTDLLTTAPPDLPGPGGRPSPETAAALRQAEMIRGRAVIEARQIILDACYEANRIRDEAAVVATEMLRHAGHTADRVAATDPARPRSRNDLTHVR